MSFQAYREKEHQMIENLFKYFPTLNSIFNLCKRDIVLTAEDRDRPPHSLRQKLVEGMVKYVMENPDQDITSWNLTRYFALPDNRRLSGFIKLAFPELTFDERHFPKIPGSTINRLRRESGFDASYIEEVMDIFPELSVGSKDITKDIKIPPKLDEDIARSAGWISTASYREGYAVRRSKLGEKRRYLGARTFAYSFKSREFDFIDYILIPFYEDYFNYNPPTFVKKGLGYWGRKGLSAKVVVCPRSIVSYYLDAIGINPVKKKRSILFQDELRDAFIGGLIDRWTGVYFNKKRKEFSCSTRIPIEFKKLAEDISQEFKRKLHVYSYGYSIFQWGGKDIKEKFERYKVSNPRLLFPVLYWNETGEYVKY